MHTLTQGSLILGTLVIGLLWLAAQREAARAEFSDPKIQGRWVMGSLLLYFAVLAFALAGGASGMLSRFDKFPPPVMFFFIGMVALGSYIAFSRFGTILVKHTPLTWLIGFHTFRLLAELALWSGLHEGLAPVQLTAHGYNYDVITGLTALPTAYWLSRTGELKIAWAWNIMGSAFLAVIAFIAMTSFPTPLQVFPDTNEWVTRLPYTLLPGVLVVAALAGHLIVFRKLALLGERPRRA